MSNYCITLKPVYSQTVPTPEGVKLPEDWSLSWHQAATLEALRNYDVVFNTAMTGDGKSLAAYLHVMTSRISTLAMYPTNELARDQEKQVHNYKDKFQPKHDPQIYRLNAAILEDFISTNKLPTKQSGLINLSNQAEIMLTNPDIFHYIHDFRYLRRYKKGDKLKGENADKLFRKIDDNYNLFIFDEFHVFSSPQVASIFNAILLIKHTTTPGKKFLFLSATPSELLQEFLTRSGISYKIINPVSQNAYCFSPTNDNWRQISQSITLNFPKGLEPSMRSSYDWLQENAKSVILKFFQDYPHSKGAIILNSIAAVKKLKSYFEEIFEPLGFKVRENTGLTGETEKAESVAEADLLLGTSTIDVGVDFRINFLVFEGADAGNFIQRFGRIGRHPGFPIYQAYALVPQFIVERLFEVESHPLRDGENYDRVTFTEAIRLHYPFVNEFRQYPKRWGAIQSACMHQELKPLSSQYPETATNFKEDVENAFDVNIWHKYKQITQCLETSKKNKKIIEEARSFRGSSQLDCAIYDATNPNEAEHERFKIYNLPGILSNFIFEWMNKAEFMRQAEAFGVNTTRIQETLCCLRLTGYRDVREDWRFYYPEDISEIAALGKVHVLQGLEIYQPHGSGINRISDAVSNRGLVCFISDRDRTYLRAKLGLPIHFQAYPLTDKYSSSDRRLPPYTIAFGKSALLLETLLSHWKPKKNEGWIC